MMQAKVLVLTLVLAKRRWYFNMKKGFSLITAIIFILLVATLGALALSLSSQGSKQTGDLYLKTQAELLARSATEYALLAISAHEINATNGCVNQINALYPNANNPLFDINVTINYLGRGLPAAPVCNILSNAVQESESNITVLLDTFVQTHDGVSTEPIRFYRRTLQKP